MIGLNSSMYTWSGGELYKHNTNTRRNEYYGVDYESSITPIFNQDSTNNKMYKTLALNSNVAWKAAVTTDLTTGVIEAGYFQKKEGYWYAHIRRVGGTVDLSAMSTQGVGKADYSGLVFTFNFKIAASIAIGDNIYTSPNPAVDALQLVGPITAFTIGSTTSTITVGSAAITPSNGDYVVSVKDSTAESYGSRGSWMEVKLSTNVKTAVELLTISSDVMKSYP